jgi:hypothetical protein
VTIAAGLSCIDGILVCADSQEVRGDFKLPVEKLITFSDASIDIAIAGSGIGPLVNMATERIIRALTAGVSDYVQAQSEIVKVLSGLYNLNLAHSDL